MTRVWFCMRSYKQEGLRIKKAKNKLWRDGTSCWLRERDSLQVNQRGVQTCRKKMRNTDGLRSTVTGLFFLAGEEQGTAPTRCHDVGREANTKWAGRSSTGHLPALPLSATSWMNSRCYTLINMEVYLGLKLYSIAVCHIPNQIVSECLLKNWLWMNELVFYRRWLAYVNMVITTFEPGLSHKLDMSCKTNFSLS